MRYFIALVACLSLTGTESTSDVVQDTSSLLCISPEHNATEQLSRRRRYLLFDKGAAVTVAVASVKSIISGVPRGMQMLNEQTMYYDLPWSVSEPKVPTKPPKRVSDWKSWSVPKYSFVSPGYARTRYMHEREANSENGSFDLGKIAAIFFQQIHQFAENYGYNGRHCILRTICDAKHFLYPEEQSLFHDVIRILLEDYMSTGLVNDQRYVAAWRVQNPMDCANLYGPHCKISFLDYFTVQIYGKFM